MTVLLCTHSFSRCHYSSATFPYNSTLCHDSSPMHSQFRAVAITVLPLSLYNSALCHEVSGALTVSRIALTVSRIAITVHTLPLTVQHFAMTISLSLCIIKPKEKSIRSWGGGNALIQREWEKCSRSNKRGVCLVCDLFHILTLS